MRPVMNDGGHPLNSAAKLLHGRALLALVALLGLAALVVLSGGQPSKAADYRSNTSCQGHTLKGDPDPEDPTSFGVKYVIKCDQPITGYSIITDKEIEGMETEVQVLSADGNVVGNNAFNCQAELPGWGVNCVGTYDARNRSINGQFYIGEPLCKERRLDPLLVVSTAGVDANKNPTQDMSGPFDLGRPRGCPKTKSRWAGKTHIPGSNESDTVLTGQEG
jgi:hypothetical protein